MERCHEYWARRSARNVPHRPRCCHYAPVLIRMFTGFWRLGGSPLQPRAWSTGFFSSCCCARARDRISDHLSDRIRLVDKRIHPLIRGQPRFFSVFLGLALFPIEEEYEYIERTLTLLFDWKKPGSRPKNVFT
jgi:hypothetical protein